MNRSLKIVVIAWVLFTSCFAVTRLVNHFIKQGNKIPSLVELPSKLPQELSLDHIQNEPSSWIFGFVRAFPLTDYRKLSVRDRGIFFVDAVDDMIKDGIRKGLGYEEHVQQLIYTHGRPGSTMLDIGAHIGSHTLSMAKVAGPQGRVVAFEPQPKIFRELVWNVAANGFSNVDFYWAALGDHRGEIELSPLNQGNEGGTSLAGGTGQYVQLMTVDSLGLKDLSLVKIDVEGMEDQVLEGAKETLLANRPAILIEIMGGMPFSSASPAVRQKILRTLATLESWGFRTTLLSGHDWLALPE